MCAYCFYSCGIIHINNEHMPQTHIHSLFLILYSKTRKLTCSTQIGPTPCPHCLWRTTSWLQGANAVLRIKKTSTRGKIFSCFSSSVYHCKSVCHECFLPRHFTVASTCNSECQITSFFSHSVSAWKWMWGLSYFLITFQIVFYFNILLSHVRSAPQLSHLSWNFPLTLSVYA